MGKNPVNSNIANELGHTYYPKWVDHKDKAMGRVLVQDAEEEAEVTGKKADKEEKKENAPGWGDKK